MITVPRSRFYTLISVTLVLLSVLGFVRTYYARPLFDLPPLPSSLQIHGAVFTAWLVLFVVQVRFIATHRVKAHMTLGIAGALLAVLVVIFGVVTAVESSIGTRPRPMGLTSAQFAAIPLTVIPLFAAFVTTALVLRRRAALHKRFMILAMIAVLGPPVARLIAAARLGDHYLAIQTTVPVVFIGWCLISDWRSQRIVHPVYSIGGTFIVLAWPLRVLLAQSDSWAVISAWIVRHAS